MHRFSLLLCLVTVGCAPSPYRIGVKAVETGDFWRACGQWLDLLDDDIYDHKPRRGVDAYKRDCWEQQLDRARQREAEGRYDEATAEYERLFAFANRLERAELLDFPTEEAELELAQIPATQAKQHYDLGKAALEEGLFTKAVHHLEAARGLQPEAKGLLQELATAYQKWAEEDLRLHKYVDASLHYRAAFALSGDQRHDAWAAAIDAALGRYALEEGFCRAAVGHLRRAHPLPFDPGLKEVLREAETCARIGVLVEPFEEAVQQQDITATALGPMLRDRLEIAFQEGSSEFLQQLDPTVLIDPAVNAAAPTKRYVVRGRVTQIAIERPPQTDVARHLPGEIVIPCSIEVIEYEGPDAICTDEVPIHYAEHSARMVVKMTGSVKVTNLLNGEQRTSPLDVQLDRVIRWVDSFEADRNGERTPIQVGAVSTREIAKVDEALLSSSRAPEPFPPESEVAGEAISKLAETAAIAIVSLVDTEKEMLPPARLQVRPPILDPQELMFAQPDRPQVAFEPVRKVITIPAATEPTVPPVDPTAPDPAQPEPPPDPAP